MKLKLKALRVQKGINQKKAAHDLGISDKTLSYWENAKSYPNIKQAYDLASYYGVGIDDIIFLPNTTV